MLALQCISFLTDGGDGRIHGNGRNMGKRADKRSAQALPSDGRSPRRRQKTQGGQDREHDQCQKQSDATSASTTAAHTGAEAQRHASLLEPGLRICSLSQCWPGGNSARFDEGKHRLEKQQGETGASSSLSGLHHGQPSSGEIPEDHGCTSRERPSQAGCQVPPH